MVFKLSLVLLTTFLAVFRSFHEIRSLQKIEIYPFSSTTPWLYNNLFKFSSSSFEIAQPNLTYLFVSRLSRYSHVQPILNLDSSHRVLYLLFVIASDCSLLNPGPVKLPCGICTKPVKCNQRAIECEECLVWFHVNCIALSTKSYADHCNDSNLVWICNLCTFPNFSTSFLLQSSNLEDENSFSSLAENSNLSEIGSPLFVSSPRGSKIHSDQPIFKKKKLKVLSLNCNGIKSMKKKADFHAIAELHNPDIIIGCESKIDSSVSTQSVFPENYEVFRKDRTVSGGGVFVAIRNDLIAVEECNLDVEGCEIIWVSLQFPKTKKLYVASYYRPPSSCTDQLDLLDDSLGKIFSRTNFPLVVLCGDFNCGGINWPDLDIAENTSHNVSDTRLLEVTAKYGLSQHVKSQTRSASGRVLDLVLSSHANVVQACNTIPGISDHDAVLFELNLSPKYAPKPPRKILKFHEGDYNGLRADIKSFTTDYLASNPESRSVEENWTIVSDRILASVDKFIPHVITKGKRHLPWVSNSIKRLMCKRDRYFKRAKRSKCQKHWDAYKKLRNFTQSRIRSAHNRYVGDILGGIVLDNNSSSRSSVKKAWSYLKSCRSESSGVPSLLWSNRVCSTDSAKAEALKEQFDTVFTDEDMSVMPTLGRSLYDSMPDIFVSSDGVARQLERIVPDKASGPDLIPARILRETAHDIAPMLAAVFQQSLDSGKLPSAWKEANVTCIYKKGQKSNPENYRPVSLTSLVCKVLEHIICSQLSQYLSTNSIITKTQHGFQRGLSCETQLVTLIHDWARVLNDHGQVDVIFLDFAKAFDCVPHQRLLGKADYYGIRGNLNVWLADFLTERRQRIVVNGSCSAWSPVKSGVPQGTVLGPILFLLYINDLPQAVSSSLKLFADDSVIYRKINTVDDHVILQNDLRQLERWAERWQMKFSPSKCHTLRITLKRQPSEFIYTICGSPVEGVRFHKHLGVYITCTLSWSKQCEEIKKKANRVLTVLQRNISSVSPAIKERSYLCLVRPVLEFSTSAWCPYTKKDMDKIESVQRRAARFVHNDYARFTSVTSLLSNLNWPTFQERRIFFDLSLFYKFQNNLVNIPFPSEMTLNYLSTRKSHNYKFNQLLPTVNAYKYSFFTRTIPVWNSLPSASVNASGLQQFQTLIRG